MNLAENFEHVKPLPDPQLTNCQLDPPPQQQTSVKF